MVDGKEKKDEEFKENLLKLLSTDNDVRRKIAEVAKHWQMQPGNSGDIPGGMVEPQEEALDAKLPRQTAECDKLRTENVRLSNEIATLRNKIVTLENQYKQQVDDLKKECHERQQQLEGRLASSVNEARKMGDLVQEMRDLVQNLKEKCERLLKERDALQKRVAELDEAVQPFQAAFAQYRALTPKTKELLHSIFPHENIWDFIFCGVREDNMTSLWDFCANTIKNGGDNLKELAALFDFFLQWNHRQYETPKYKRLALVPGEKYSEDTAQRDRTSEPQGKIVSVLFQGLAYVANNKVFRKSIVHVAR
ncbi:MAG: hypothetical protein IJS08_11450 [Victivallales bacterium]|nr:hypothetical protein [Victivallales bacterium]